MRTVGIKLLRRKLSEYARLAANGETIIVTSRGHVVAELVPPRSIQTGRGIDPALSAMVRQGWLTLPGNPSEGTPPRAPVMTYEELMRDLAHDRSDR
jgi:antitoxin (DNA-binding transcriptional repressor) of toxin-antitoxin stability system